MIEQNTHAFKSAAVSPGVLVDNISKKVDSRQDLPQDGQTFSALMGDMSQQSDIVVKGALVALPDSMKGNASQAETVDGEMPLEVPLMEGQDVSLVMSQLSLVTEGNAPSSEEGGVSSVTDLTSVNEASLNQIDSQTGIDPIIMPASEASGEPSLLSLSDELVQSAEVTSASVVSVDSMSEEGQVNSVVTSPNSISSALTSDMTGRQTENQPQSQVSMSSDVNEVKTMAAPAPALTSDMTGRQIENQPQVAMSSTGNIPVAHPLSAQTRQAVQVPVSKQGNLGGDKAENSQGLNGLTGQTSSGVVSSGMLGGQAAQTAGQNMGQNSGQTPDQAQMQRMMSELQKTNHIAAQQAKDKFSETLTAAKNKDSVGDKDLVGSLIGSPNLVLDKNTQLPLGLQSISTPVRHPQWGQALGQRVVLMANQKIQEAKITLNPEKLGPVQVKLHMDKDKVIHVSMLAQHGTTREAMENALPRLKEMLDQAGIEFGSVDVGDQQQFDQEQAEEELRGRAARMGANADPSDATNDESQNTTILELKNDNIVDYYA